MFPSLSPIKKMVPSKRNPFLRSNTIRGVDFLRKPFSMFPVVYSHWPHDFPTWSLSTSFFIPLTAFVLFYICGASQTHASDLILSFRAQHTRPPNLKLHGFTGGKRSSHETHLCQITSQKFLRSRPASAHMPPPPDRSQNQAGAPRKAVCPVPAFPPSQGSLDNPEFPCPAWSHE